MCERERKREGGGGRGKGGWKGGKEGARKDDIIVRKRGGVEVRKGERSAKCITLRCSELD